MAGLGIREKGKNPFWNTRMLQTKITSYEQLMRLCFPTIKAESKELLIKKGCILPVLQSACQGIKKVHPGFDFFNAVLPWMQQCAAQFPAVFPNEEFPQVGAQQARIVSLTQVQAVCAHCAAFLGVFPPPNSPAVGEYTFDRLILQSSGMAEVAVARVMCQLNYLYHMYLNAATQHSSDEDGSIPPPTAPTTADNLITFERVVLKPTEEVMWATDNTTQLLMAPPSVDGEESAGGGGGGGAGEVLGINISADQRIEDVDGDTYGAHVDFANKQIHIGCIIPSCTQEEVLFSIRPDCFLSMPMFETLEANEAVVIRGAMRFSTYSGYLDSFRFVGDYDSSATLMGRMEKIRLHEEGQGVGALSMKKKKTGGEEEPSAPPAAAVASGNSSMNTTTSSGISILGSTHLQATVAPGQRPSKPHRGAASEAEEQKGLEAQEQKISAAQKRLAVLESENSCPAVLVVDAIVNRGDQFSSKCVQRDLHKMYVSLYRLKDITGVSTGNWGCGIFRGDPTLKLLQQLMAAAVCQPRKELAYSTFGKPEQAKEFLTLTSLLQKKQVSVGQVYRWIAEWAGMHQFPPASPVFHNFILKKVRDL